MEDRTDRQPLDLLDAIREFAPLDLPPGVLFPAFGSGRAEAHVVRWLLLGAAGPDGGAVGLVAPERRGVRVITADADHLRSSWFPIDWRCADRIIACRGDLTYVDPPAFLSGDVLWEAWQRSRLGETECAARISVPAAAISGAAQDSDGEAPVALEFRPDRNEVRVGRVTVRGNNGAGQPTAFIATRKRISDLFDFGAWQVRVTVSVPPTETRHPLVLSLPRADQRTTPDPSWPSNRSEVEAWLLWAALRAS